MFDCTTNSQEYDDHVCKCDFPDDEFALYQPHLPLAHRILLIEQAVGDNPNYSGLINLIESHSTSEITGLALTWSTEQLGESYLCDIGRTALVLRLPVELEPHLSEFMSTVPSEMNIFSLDLLRSVSVWSWSIAGVAEVCLRADTVREAMKAVQLRCEVLETAVRRCPGPLIRPFLPLVVVAGNSLAFGGLAVSRDWDEGLGICQSSSGCNWKPYRVFDDEKLNEAEKFAQEHGTMPFYGKLWSASGNTSPRILLPYLVPVNDD